VKNTLSYPQRSVLSTPGSRPDMIEKALRSDADVVFLDLEDAVAPQAKAEARRHVITALLEADWRGRPRVIRINGVDTPWCYRDLVDIVEAAGSVLDVVIVPKVRSAADIVFVDTLLQQLEQAINRHEPIQLEVQIETAAGVMHCDQIAQASSRLISLVWGPGDYAASVGIPARAIGTTDDWDTHYPGHRFHYPMHRILVAARATGLRAIDGPYADFRDADGLRHSCLIARALGYDGKWCIHPAQIPIVNGAFTPTEDEVRWAQEVLDAYSASQRAGVGAVALGATMLDAASLRMAQSLLLRARAAGIVQ